MQRLPKPKRVLGSFPKKGQKWFAVGEHIAGDAYYVFAIFRRKVTAEEYSNQWDDCRVFPIILGAKDDAVISPADDPGITLQRLCEEL